MLKKKYKPSRLNKWYTKHFVLTPHTRGQAEVTEVVLVWWCFMSFLYNDSLLNIICAHGATFIEILKKEMTPIRNNLFLMLMVKLCVFRPVKGEEKDISNKSTGLFTKLRMIPHLMNNN